YQVASEDGSGYIRKRVFLAALEGEQKMWANREPQRASFSHENYTFQDGAVAADGLASFVVAPRRKDMLLVEGSLFVLPTEGALVALRVERVRAAARKRVRLDPRPNLLGLHHRHRLLRAFLHRRWTDSRSEGAADVRRTRRCAGQQRLHPRELHELAGRSVSF